jgi:HTH-type transcriptional regulator/antitoxin HipB
MNSRAKEQVIGSVQQVAALLRQRRKARRRPQRELAAKLGLSQARFSVLESDPAGLTLERLLALANLLDLEVVIRDRANKASTAGW